ncbi:MULTISPECIES: RNA polymerase sigma factor SigZ [Priestia]|uniref:RNA polymerase sigma factor SigZ n=1 Tax=Priestia TaxID=2800373 RepID=UPI0018742B4B|nr:MULTISPECIES: RNA polymerase sigma factor SigZ [Priestia]MBE5098042.1 RNA polymerase sigma factor SigZ [Priestia aryabhattai]MEC1068001.1 RNA polymerase sigma factor SigZ [Priestia megaterium]
MNIEDVWNEFHHPLKRFIAKRVHDHSKVDDILQEVFIKINSHFIDLKDEEKMYSWIYQIARNTTIDFYRKEKSTEKLSDYVQLCNETSDENFSKEASACIQSTMQRLPQKYLEALELYEFQGLSQKELSEKLGVSYSGAKSRVQRGRKKLKYLLEGCCHIESDRYGNIVDFRILKD